MLKMDNRAANWNKWSLIPHAKIWEIVALSLDIEPGKVRPRKVKFVSSSWKSDSMADIPEFDECQEFLDRLAVLKANAEARESPLLNPIVDGTGYTSSWKLCISEVGAWAVSVGWDLPHAFPRQAKERMTLPNEPINENKSRQLVILIQASYKFWAKADKSDPTTHPKNADVKAWLQEHKFSDMLAEKGATIIRPDWAHKGRKPEE